MSGHVLASAGDTPTWRGSLDLRFSQGPDTVMQVVEARMPLAIQRPFYPEGADVCHAVVLHPPGGMAGGDRLEIALHLEPGTQALLTTPAANKWYRSSGLPAAQIVRACVDTGAHLEWLPQESIVFDGALAHQTMRVELAPGATWLGWDITRFGRSACGERFDHGHWRNSIEVWRGGTPLWIDRQRLEGGSRLLDRPFGLSGMPVTGCLAWLGQVVETTLAEEARRLWTAQPRHGEAGVTRLEEGLLCRYRGPSSAEARAWFVAVWDMLRRHHRNRAACPPRIWNT
ncbi:MAG: urease accessory protein UreD [Gammaproteobacteria bacterium]|nr:urease accessory protein UreD [Gammaproteobacteria bacterium]